MTQAYVVTEGKFDAEILKRLLPENIVREIEFVEGSGSYSAQSLASSILAVKRVPVALVVDADTKDELTIGERSDSLRWLLRQASPGVRFEVFPAVPEIETVLFQDKSLLERLTQQELTDPNWEIAKRHPKEFLTDALGERYKDLVLERMLSNLTDETIEVLQKHPLVRELSEFLSSVINGS